jgi:hypothetical protein
MSGLPSFFQQRGKTVLDELADYELGGDLDEEELEEEEIGYRTPIFLPVFCHRES